MMSPYARRVYRIVNSIRETVNDRYA